jgi:drug/metabolite transporter (DMT)-like permease
MAGWLCALTIMALAGRELSTELSTFQIMLFRSSIALALTLAFWFSLGRPSLATRRLGAHFTRNLVHYGAQFCWFLAISILPLAQVISVEFTAPAWTALFAAMFLGERLTPTRILAIVLGFIGVVVILRPGLEALNYAMFIVLAAAIGFGVVMALTKTLSGSEAPIVVLFYMHSLQLAISTGPAIWYWEAPSAAIAPWTLVVGVAGFFSHYCLTRAMALADATVVTPLDFLRLPIMIIAGYLLYAESIDLFVFVGASLILSGNLINVRQESRP